MKNIKNIAFMAFFVMTGLTSSSLFATKFQNNTDVTVTLQGPRGKKTIAAGKSDSFIPVASSLTFTVSGGKYNSYNSGKISRDSMPDSYVISVDENNNIVLNTPVAIQFKEAV